MSLTAREVAVVAYLAAREGRPVERSELYAALWPGREEGSERAVDDCLRRLRKKLERVPSQPEHLLSVWGTGYLFAGATEEVEPLPQPSPRRTIPLGEGTLVDLTRHVVVRHGQERALSSNEVRLLEALAERRDVFVPRQELIRGVFGPRGERALENLLRRLRAKIEDDPGQPRWLLTVRDRGIRLAAAEPRWEPSALPVYATPLEGRAAELRRLEQMLCEPGWVTICGPAGVGKTRLACAFGKGRAVFCSLDGVETRGELIASVGQALGIGADGTVREEDLAEVLAPGRPVLLVLDGFEHLRAHGAVVQRWSRTASVLVTSRVPLGLEGESRLPLAPLDPEAALRLLVDRVRAVSPEIDAGAAREDLEAIAAQLDRIPLALELAAGWLSTLSAPRLRDLLARDQGGLPDDESRLLARAVDRSWALLRPPEREGLLRLATCRQGVGDEDAMALLADLEQPAASILRALCEGSLVSAHLGPQRSRYRVYDAVARACRLHHPERMQELREHHARHFAGLGSPEALAALRQQGCEARYGRLLAERANLTAAADQAIRAAEPSLAVGAVCALLTAAELAGGEAAAVERGEAVLALPGLRPEGALEVRLALYDVLQHSDLRARAREVEAIRELASGEGDPLSLGRAAVAEARMLPPRAAVRAWRRAIALLSRSGDGGMLGRAHRFLGTWHADASRPDEAAVAWRTALALQQRAGDLAGLGATLISIGRRAGIEGRYGEALRRYEEAVALFRRIGHRRAEALALLNIGVQHLRLRRWDEAQGAFLGSLERYRDLTSPRQVAMIHVNLGTVHYERGELDAAEASFVSGLELADRAAEQTIELHALSQLAQIDEVRGRPLSARARLEAALARPRSPSPVLVFAWGQMAAASQAAGDPRGAHDALSQAAALARRLGSPFVEANHLCTAAVVLSRLGACTEAGEALQRARELCEILPRAQGSTLELHLEEAAEAVGGCGDLRSA